FSSAEGRHHRPATSEQRLSHIKQIAIEDVDGGEVDAAVVLKIEAEAKIRKNIARVRWFRRQMDDMVISIGGIHPDHGAAVDLCHESNVAGAVRIETVEVIKGRAVGHEVAAPDERFPLAAIVLRDYPPIIGRELRVKIPAGG